jgi:arginyl-tRNA synthetase
VANQQSLHFEQLFKASRLLGYSHRTEMVHIKFGLILGKDGKKMSTREGGVVDLIDIIEQGVQKAKEIIKKKNKDLRGGKLEKTARQIAVGAIKYNDLSQNRLTDIIFDWDKMLSLESGSSPYLQYTYVRIKSILKKAKNRSANACRQLNLEAEIRLAKQLLKYPETVSSAAEEYKPNLLANYLEKLATLFHAFYEQAPVLKTEKETRQSRIALIKATAQIMQSGLNLLGIETPDKM